MLRFLSILSLLLVGALIFHNDIGIGAGGGKPGPEALPNASAPAFASALSQSQSAAGAPANMVRALLDRPQIANAAMAASEASVELSKPSQILSSTSAALDEREKVTSYTALSPVELKTAVQTEMQRLGCYTAAIDGLWGPKSRAAVDEFNVRMDADFALKASADLLGALKDAPPALCSRDCSASPDAPNACSLQAGLQPDAPAADEVQQDATGSTASYLPPWMQGKKLASADPDFNPAAEQVEIAPAKPKTAKKRAPRKRVAATRRSVKKHARKSWLPDGWPGSHE